MLNKDTTGKAIDNYEKGVKSLFTSIGIALSFIIGFIGLILGTITQYLPYSVVGVGIMSIGILYLT